MALDYIQQSYKVSNSLILVAEKLLSAGLFDLHLHKSKTYLIISKKKKGGMKLSARRFGKV